MLIDDFLPRWDVASHHDIDVRAPAAVAYRAVREVDLSRPRLVSLLFAVRGLPALIAGKRRSPRRSTINAIADHGFAVLAEDPGRELVLGVIGRFWRPSGDILHVRPDRFRETNPSGVAKGVMNVTVTPHDDSACVVSTQTRVLCTDQGARRRFRLYWRLVGPFSGAIRHALLREVKRAAESAARNTSVEPT